MLFAGRGKTFLQYAGVEHANYVFCARSFVPAKQVKRKMERFVWRIAAFSQFVSENI